MILIFTGKSASGKSTMENLITDNLRYDKIISTTTRPIRAGETDGVDYHFVTDSEFETMKENNEFLETTNYRGWNYGATKKELEEKKNAIFVIDSVGFRTLKKSGMDFISFYITVPDQTRYIRQLLRGDDIMETALRSERDKACFQDFEKEVDFVVNNDSDEWSCVLEILRCVESKTRG